MTSKDTRGYLTVLDKDGNVIQQSGNVSFRMPARYRILYKWNGSTSVENPYIFFFPWKLNGLLVDDDINVGHVGIGGNNYPVASGTRMDGNRSYGYMRLDGTTDYVGAGDIARVFGAVGSYNNTAEYGASFFGKNIISVVDLPLAYTQVGTVYFHPATLTGNTVNITAGSNIASFGDGSFFDNNAFGGPSFNMVRIETGADAGYYLVQAYSHWGNQFYLYTLDGKPFSAQATATVPITLCAGRRAWFNEVSVIPLSVGTADTGTSKYAPRIDDPYLRGSFIVRLTLDKSGSTEASSGTEQQGSYLLSVREYTHGEGGYGQNIHDYGGLLTGNMSSDGGTPTNFNFWSGAVNGMALDWENQRMWFAYTNAADASGIAVWKYKLPEAFREIANYAGNAAHASFISPGITLGAADRIVGVKMGSNVGSANNRVYFAISHTSGGNGGIAIVKPDLTTLQYKYSSGALPTIPSPNISSVSLDRSRTRVGTAADVTTTAATNLLNSASGLFAAADVGRAISLTGASADNGVYLISVVNSATQVQVTTTAGVAVSFTGGTGGTYDVGDRLYLFFNNTTTNANKMTYMEALAPGVFFQTAVTMTNAAQGLARVAGYSSVSYGNTDGCSVDQDTGDVYWLSVDTVQQINKYTLATNTHEFIAINNANLLSPAGGSPANPGTPGTFTTIKVSSKFDDIWVGSDAGHFRITKSASWAGGTGSPAALSVRRFYGGLGEGTAYFNPAGTPRLSGVQRNYTTNVIRGYYEGPDGRMWSLIRFPNEGTVHVASYSHETENWYDKDQYNTSNGVETPYVHIDKYGASMWIYPSNYQYGVRVFFSFTEVQYQWDSVTSTWFPREWVQTGTPNKSTTDTLYNPGALAKPIHSGLEEVFKRVKFKFNRQGGATPPNNEFLGRMGQSRATATDGQTNASSSTFTGSGFSAGDVGKLLRIETPTTNTDGATVAGSATFTGSGFVSGDVGKYLRINAGADIGTYRISAYASGTSVTLRTVSGKLFAANATAGTLSYSIDRGADSGLYKITAYIGVTQVTLSQMNAAAWSATATGSVNYSVWDLATPGSNAGPETITVLAADGISKDNTQDITGTTFEHFGIKMREYINAEPRKFAVSNPIAPPGATETKVYWEPYGRSSAQYDAATSHHRALPAPTTGAEAGLGFDSCSYAFNGAGTRPTLYSSPVNGNDWYGIYANNSVLGFSLMADLGADVEIGYIMFRFYSPWSPARAAYTTTYNGLIANVYKANSSGGAPAASSTIRTSGSAALSVSGANVTTVTLSTGDFLGAVTTGPFTNGNIVATQSTFVAPGGTFVTGDYGKILKISGSAGADSGAYRVTAVSPDGSTLTIRNLDQTAKTWSVSAAGVTYEVRDGVREEDMLCIPSLASPTHKLCVERLLTATSAQIRTGPNAGVSNQNWEAVAPSWTPVKRLSYSTEAQPPDVKNNGTWLSFNGAEAYTTNDFKVYFDLTDLTQAQRTGRWWKWTALPRFNGNQSDSAFYLKGIEFYDTAGNKIAQSKYTSNDQVQTNPDYYNSWVNRIDWIQSADDAVGAAGYNGNASLGGVNGDTITLVGGGSFLGFQVGPTVTDGALTLGDNKITSASSSFPASAVIGRTIRITTGANAGNLYRVSARPTANQVTVTTPSGSAVAWGAAETSVNFTVHEGISAGNSTPDKFVFTSDGSELTIASINDTMTAITITEYPQVARTNQAWEIKRPGYMDYTATTVNASKLGRVLMPWNTFPVQSGDMSIDYKGHHRFFAEDVGNGAVRSDGSCAGGNTFTGSGFSKDDIGRLLYIDTGANKGIYEISEYASSTSITVKNHYTGGSVTLAADAGPITYRVFGERRVRLAKYLVGLRN